LEKISVGSDGTVWGINPREDVYRFNFDTQRFDQIPGALRQIAVGAGDAIWGINAAGLVFHFDGASFVETPGILAQIAVGGSGSGGVWGLN
jgi:hypothetical protein